MPEIKVTVDVDALIDFLDKNGDLKVSLWETICDSHKFVSILDRFDGKVIITLDDPHA